MIEVYKVEAGQPHAAKPNALIDNLEVPPKGMLPAVGDIVSLVDSREEPSLLAYRVVGREFRWERTTEATQAATVATWAKIWYFVEPAESAEPSDTAETFADPE